MEDSGTAYFSYPTSTKSTVIMDKVNGNCMEKVEPAPSSEEMLILPPKDSIVFLTTSKPTPRPEISEICYAVEKPLAIINWNTS